MTLHVNDGSGATKGAVNARFYSAGGAEHVIARMHVNDAGGTARLFYQRAAAASISPAGVSGFSASRAGPVYSDAAMASVSGGSAPYIYAWSIVSGTGIGITAPTSQTTAFSGNPPPDGEIDGTAQVVITDASGLTATAAVDISLSRFAFDGGAYQ